MHFNIMENILFFSFSNYSSIKIMHDRTGVYLHDRFLLRRTPTQVDQRFICPPWRHTQIPVELFDLTTLVSSFEN
jgi:hypothetical protein